MLYFLNLLLFFVPLVLASWYQNADFPTLETASVVSYMEAINHENACFKQNTACIFKYTFPESSFAYPNDTYKINVTLNRQLCSKRFQNTDVNTELQQTSFIVQNKIWQFVMQVGECITILNGTAEITESRYNLPNIDLLTWTLVVPEIQPDLIFKGFAVDLIFTDYNNVSTEYIIHTKCDIFISHAKKIIPFLKSDIILCAHYLWTNTSLIPIHAFSRTWSNLLDNMITVHARQVQGTIMDNNVFQNTNPLYYEKSLSIPSDNNDIHNLQSLSTYGTNTYFTKAIFSTASEHGIHIYGVNVLAIDDGTTFWKYNDKVIDKTIGVLFIYRDNTPQNHISIFIESNQGTVVYFRRWYSKEYGYPHKWIA